VNPSLNFVVVKHNPITIDGDIVGGGSVNPTTLDTVSGYGDVGGGISVGDEVLKVSHSCLP